jgi:hypothetical protein
VTTSWASPSAACDNDPTSPPLISAVAETLLRVSAVDSPTDQDRAEARRLAIAVVNDAALTFEASPGLSEWTRNQLIDLAALVAADPETASVEQVREVAHSLKALLAPSSSGTKR